ncbi:hypothetical protein phiLo_07 [Thermus phage phiLo]|nr:hypothetical protein phiLo_07 [Thermus phage phiLo]
MDEKRGRFKPEELDVVSVLQRLATTYRWISFKNSFGYLSLKVGFHFSPYDDLVDFDASIEYLPKTDEVKKLRLSSVDYDSVEDFFENFERQAKKFYGDPILAVNPPSRGLFFPILSLYLKLVNLFRIYLSATGDEESEDREKATLSKRTSWIDLDAYLVYFSLEVDYYWEPGHDSLEAEVKLGLRNSSCSFKVKLLEDLDLAIRFAEEFFKYALRKGYDREAEER